MEEKNEEIEINLGNELVIRPPKKSFLKKLTGLIKFCFTFFGVACIALIITAYYREDVRNIVKVAFPNARIPEKFAYKDDVAPTIVSSLDKTIPKDTLSNNDKKLTPVQMFKNNEKTMDEIVKSLDSLDAEVTMEEPKIVEIESDVKDMVKVDADVQNDVLKPEAEEQKVTEIIVTEVVADDIGEVKFEEIKDQEKTTTDVLDENTKDKIVKTVKNMATENNFTNSSFDPVVKSLERVPADKYSALPLEEKFLDLMNKNSELVAIVGEMSNRIARLEKTQIDPMLISAMIDKIEKVNSKVVRSPKSDTKSSMVIASSFLRYAILEGRSFVHELDTMKLLATENNSVTQELKNLEVFAIDGIRTFDILEKEFKDAVSLADGYVMASQTADLKGKILDKMSELIVIKRIDGKPVNQALVNLDEAVIPLLRKGGISEVIALIDNEDAKIKEYFKDFIANANEAMKAIEVLNKVNLLIADAFKASFKSQENLK